MAIPIKKPMILQEQQLTQQRFDGNQHKVFLILVPIYGHCWSLTSSPISLCFHFNITSQLLVSHFPGLGSVTDSAQISAGPVSYGQS